MGLAEGITKGIDMGTELALKKFDMDMAQARFNATMGAQQAEWDRNFQETKRSNLVKELEDNIKTPGLGQEYLKGVHEKLIELGHPGLPMIDQPLPEGVQGPTQPQFYSMPSPEEALRAKLKVEDEFKDSDLTGTAKNLEVILGRTPTMDDLKSYGKDESNPYFSPVQTSSGLMIFNNRTGSYTPAQADGKPVLPVNADPELAGKIETSKETAKADVEKKTNFPKAKNKYDSLNRQWKNLDTQIDKAISKVGPFTSGVGAWVSVVPATPQKDLSKILETIKANIGFDKLQDMRQNSPTGGALGQVSDFENKLLQAVQGSLDQSQSPSQLIENLKNIKTMLGGLRNQTDFAFNFDYKEIMGNDSPPIDLLKQGTQTEFDNGQVWTLENGKPKRVK